MFVGLFVLIKMRKYQEIIQKLKKRLISDKHFKII